jgi:hypothetical protein
MTIGRPQVFITHPSQLANSILAWLVIGSRR